MSGVMDIVTCFGGCTIYDAVALDMETGSWVGKRKDSILRKVDDSA